MQNAWFHQLWQVFQILKLQSSPRSSHYHHHIWLLVWCSFYEMLCWFYARCNGTHAFQKVLSQLPNFCLISPQNIRPKVLGIIKIFFGKCETSLCVLFGQQWLLPWNSPMDAVLPSLFLIVKSWTLTLIEASEACRYLDGCVVIALAWEGSPLFQIFSICG